MVDDQLVPCDVDFGRAVHAVDLLHSEEVSDKIIESAKESWDKLVTLGQSLLSAEKWCAWTMGKLLAAVETKWGEESIKEFAKDIGISESRAYALRRTYLAFPTLESRDMSLSFGHHEVAACRPEPQAVIQLAAEKHLTVRELRTVTSHKQLPPIQSSSPDPDVKSIIRTDLLSSVDVAKEVLLFTVENIINKFCVDRETIRGWIDG